MRILFVHNTYQHRGGEDIVVESEIELLRSRGHRVELYLRHNNDIERMSSLALAVGTLWSSRTSRELAKLIRRFRPSVIHSHNTFPLISPSLYWAAERDNVPVVQTLHNFRLICLNALFLRSGNVCEDCMGQGPWRGVVHACYRQSHTASAVLAGMLTLHRGLNTYQTKVARFIALNDFCRSKFIEGGLPSERVVVKPNFVDFDAFDGSLRRTGLLYAGRLSVEKGIPTLADALAISPGTLLRVAGDGPEAFLLEGVRGVVRLGSLTSDSIRQEMGQAVALVVPSIWYENFPRTIVEAFACGLPVIASRIGALADIVRDGETGLLFEPANSRDLAEKLVWAQTHQEQMMTMGRNARLLYEARFSAEVNYRSLMAIYAEAIAEPQIE